VKPAPHDGRFGFEAAKRFRRRERGVLRRWRGIYFHASDCIDEIAKGFADGEPHNGVAPKLCKPRQGTENRVVSLRGSELFHKLINTCVENFTKQKYLGGDSARALQAARLRTGFHG
jgi:hypothetical protein